MSALTLVKRKRVNRDLAFCSNRCRRPDGMLRQATFVAWILGRPSPLCSPCAKAWPVMWADALAGHPDREDVAA